MNFVKIAATMLCLALTMTACGGGGSTGSAPAPAASKSYTIVLQGDLPAAGVNGVQFDLILAPGVTVNVDSTTSALQASSLGGTPSGSLLESKFANGSVSIAIISATGFGGGVLATLTCNLTQASAPPASAFTVQNVKVIGASGAAIPVATVALE